MQSLSFPLSGELTCSPSQLDLLFRSGQEQGKPGTTAFTPGNSYQTPRLHHSKYPGHREVWQRTSVCLRVMLLTRFVIQSGCSAHKSALPHCGKLGCKTSGSHINPGTQDVCLPSASPAVFLPLVPPPWESTENPILFKEWGEEAAVELLQCSRLAVTGCNRAPLCFWPPVEAHGSVSRSREEPSAPESPAVRRAGGTRCRHMAVGLSSCARHCTQETDFFILQPRYLGINFDTKS